MLLLGPYRNTLQSPEAMKWEVENRIVPDRKVHGAKMGPIWGRQDPDGPMLAPWTLSGVTR